MNVGQLKEMLEQYDDDADVRIASQPNYPFEYRLAGLVSAAEVEANQRYEEHGEAVAAASVTAPNVVYLAEGGQIGYSKRAIWEALEW